MTYNKPQVDVLGKAVAVIEQIVPKPLGTTDGFQNKRTSPAYDLDE